LQPPLETTPSLLAYFVTVADICGKLNKIAADSSPDTGVCALVQNTEFIYLFSDWLVGRVPPVSVWRALVILDAMGFIFAFAHASWLALRICRMIALFAIAARSNRRNPARKNITGLRLEAVMCHKSLLSFPTFASTNVHTHTKYPLR